MNKILIILTLVFSTQVFANDKVQQIINALETSYRVGCLVGKVDTLARIQKRPITEADKEAITKRCEALAKEYIEKAVTIEGN